MKPLVKPFVPARLEPLAFAFLLSGLMSFFVTGIATALHFGADFAMSPWIAVWLPSWPVAFIAALVTTPLVRRLLKFIVMPKG